MKTIYQHSLLITILLYLSSCANDDTRTNQDALSETLQLDQSTLQTPDNNTTNHSESRRYAAEIIRTAYGIPHITAADWLSLGYGHGYSYAQDNYCTLMREIIIAEGRSAEFFGPDGDTSSDFIFTYINHHNDALSANQLLAVQPQRVKDLLMGYTDGFNRYLIETGSSHLSTGEHGCRDASWVRLITLSDMILYLRKIALGGSTDNAIIRKLMIDTQAPETAVSSTAKIDPPQTFRALKKFAHRLGPRLGSNAIVLGSEYTQSAKGMVLGNPHQPWQGSGRWYQIHLTIPGVYNIMGATLQGMPMVGIGFNAQLAWTHTVSFANRFTLFELQLNPDNPLQYRFDGQWRDINSQTVSIKMRLEDGSLGTQQHTFYSSHFGPILELGSQLKSLSGWPMFSGTVMSLRDANINNVRGVEQWIKMGEAQTMDAFIDALKMIGNPLFHVLAADRQGEIFYGDISAIPNVTQATLDNCVTGVVAPLITNATNNTIVALDGSRTECEWGTDSDAPKDSNIFGFQALPKFRRNDYAANANNSYWLSNTMVPLTGFPTTMGAIGQENTQQFLRTRLMHLMIADQIKNTNHENEAGKFNLQRLQTLMYANRVYGAEITLSDIFVICDALTDHTMTEDQQRAMQACNQLRLWDQRVNIDSVGAHIFTEFWRALRSSYDTSTITINSEALWRHNFDPADPINTPRGINTDLPINHTAVIAALNQAITAIENAGLALDTPFGEVQYDQRSNQSIPIHGGYADMGVFGAISSALNVGGYNNIRSGNSYIQTVTWDDSQCPIAEGILTHSQSIDPESPHFVDQTLLYAEKGWIQLPFCEEDILTNTISRKSLRSEDLSDTQQ